MFFSLFESDGTPWKIYNVDQHAHKLYWVRKEKRPSKIKANLEMQVLWLWSSRQLQLIKGVAKDEDAEIEENWYFTKNAVVWIPS